MKPKHKDPVIAAAQDAVRSLCFAHGNDAVAEAIGIRRVTLDEIARRKRLIAPGAARDLAAWDGCEDPQQASALTAYADQIEREGFPPRD